MKRQEALTYIVVIFVRKADEIVVISLLRHVFTCSWLNSNPSSRYFIIIQPLHRPLTVGPFPSVLPSFLSSLLHLLLHPLCSVNLSPSMPSVLRSRSIFRTPPSPCSSSRAVDGFS